LNRGGLIVEQGRAQGLNSPASTPQLPRCSKIEVGTRQRVTKLQGGQEMTNYREIMRLRSLGLNNSQIAESLGASRTTVIHTLQRAAAQGLDWTGRRRRT